MTLATGQILQDRYRIVSMLGQGGMGAVYRAWDMRLDVVMALKEMVPQPGLDSQTLAELRRQFQQEAVVLARLHHPHLVRVTDFFEEGGSAYLVMDFVEGESLDQRIEREGSLPEAQVLEWADQLLGALAYCHAQGVIHRDVKPQNVVIRPDGEATLVDFGLVKLWDPHDPRTRTAMRGMGTPEYAPPEQYDTQMGHTDPRSDVYSLGATIYHVLTGQAPPTATMRIASPGTFQLPRALNPRLSPTMEAAVMRATELAVDNRFATAQDMAAALRGEAPPVGPAPAGTKVIPGVQPVSAAGPTYDSMRAIPAAQPAPPARRKPVPAWAWVVGGGMLALAAGLIAMTAIVKPWTNWGSGPTPTSRGAATAVAAVLEATKTATPSPSPSPTRASPTPSPTSTPTRTPTRTPRPTSTPKRTPSPTPTPKAPTTPTAVPTSRAPTRTPAATAPPPSGALITFEQWPAWQRGDQPYGELTQSQEQARSGRYSAKLRYNFPAAGDDYVVFVHPMSLAGQPNTIGAWVYGDGSGHYVNVWVQDAQNEMWSVHLGRVGDARWQQMAGTLAPNLPWPSGHVSGPDNGVVDYPVRFHALVVDRPGSGPQSGQIYIDDVSVWRSETAPTPPPATAVPATPPGGAVPTTVTGEPPVSAGPLDFPTPTQLDGWETIEGGHRATIIVHISGGAPPFMIYHDTDVFVTDQRDYPIKFRVGGCAIIHSITVESADGQSVTHDYYIRAPSCD
jgi:serine/threonine protein kinase